MTQRSEPIFNVPAVVVALVIACVFVHVPPQFVCPAGQPQTPLLHTPPTAHW